MPPPVDDDHLSALFRALGSVDRLAPEALSRLESFVRTADDYELFRVNPIQYGAAQDLSETQAIELFVHAAKVGLFEMDWLLICAYCPQVAGSFRDLDQLHPRSAARFATRSTMWGWTTIFKSPSRSRAACATSFSIVRKSLRSRTSICVIISRRASLRRSA
jgi:hypothetical protein